jgi:hypothetical protein
MPLDLVEIGTSVGAGIVDNVLVELEEQGKITGDMTKIKDAIRIAGAFGGLVVNEFVAKGGTTMDRVSGALALSELPLAMHSIRKLVKGALKYTPSGGLRLVSVGAPQLVPPPATAPRTAPSAVLTSY